MKRLALSLLLALPACFSGEATIGSVCRADADCGADQSCERGFCGICGDGVSQAGEVCLEPASSLLPPADVVAVGDFDENGRGDLLVETGTDRGMLLGTAAGFETAELPPAAVPHKLLIPGDVDGDEHTDVVGLALDGSTGTVLYGDGAGGVTEVDVPLLAGAVDVRISGAAEIWAAIDNRVVTVSVVGRELQAGPEVDVGARIEHLIGPVLINPDDRSDLVCVLGSGGVVVLTSDEAGGLVPVQSEGFSGRALDTWLSDVDGDGYPELLGLLASGVVEIITSGEDGAFSPGTSFPTVAGAQSIAVFDANADRIRDVVVFGGSSGASVHTGLVRGFEPAVEIVSQTMLVEVVQLLVGSDSYPDLVLVPEGAPITVLEATP